MRRALAVAAVLISVVASGCEGDGDRRVLSPVVLGMLETTAPAYDDGQEQIFQVSREVRLPFRQVGERPGGERDPYPRPAFHVLADSRTTVRRTSSRFESVKRTVELLIDPWNEFVRYVPGFANVREDEVVPNTSGIQRTFLLEPRSRVEGILTPDDMVELAVDLTTAMALALRPPDGEGELGGPTLYNRAFDRQNRSSEPDAVLAPWLPGRRDSIATVTGFDLGLRTAEAARVAVELVIDVEDVHGERIVEDGEEARAIGRPGETLEPPAAARP